MKGFLRELLHDQAMEHHETFSQYSIAMKNGEYDHIWRGNYIPCIYQESRHEISDIWSFARIHTWICLGWIAYVGVKVGFPPGKNADVTGNNQKISTLPSPFYAKFIPETGAAAESDGYIAWRDDIVIENSDDSRNEYWVLPPGHAPLEVGSTSGHVTFYHLLYHGRVARWPYHSDTIWLMAFVRNSETIGLVDAKPATPMDIAIAEAVTGLL